MRRKLFDWGTDTLLRTIKTMAQTATGIIGSAMMIHEVSWESVLSASCLAGILCILMNVGNIKEN